MRVIVLGGTRFIGRAIVEELAGAGCELLIVHRGQLEPDGMPEVEHLHADRMDLATHRSRLAAFMPDAAIDCRALTRIDSEVVVNALPAGIRLVVISSVDVYRAFGALHDERETDPVPLDEDSPIRPNRYPYRGKLPGMDDYDKLDVEDVYLPRGATSVRLPMVYGERDYQLREEFLLRRVRAGLTQAELGHLIDDRGLMAALERAMEAHAGDGIAVGVEAQDEQRDAGALFEVGASQRALKSPTAKDSFGLIEVDLP